MNKGSQCFDFEDSFFSPNCDLRNCYIEKKANLKMSNDELLCDQIYNLTQEFGRIQFVREIMNLQKENKKLKSVLNEVKEYIKEKELKDIKGNTLYCEENLIWHELALILAKVGDLDES